MLTDWAGKWRSFMSVLIIFIVTVEISFAAVSPIVQIKNGTLEGIVVKSRNGREIASFRGIPYAQPPVGELRFEPPRPFDSWAGVRSAQHDGNVCPQRDFIYNRKNVIGVEDCLYLNVYTPKSFGNDNQSKSYPVMIWLHGGAWSMHSAHSLVFGPEFLLDHEIVLVASNYRLGPLGFLSTEDFVSPGNQGLKDQAQAIRWVHENIAAFGGDPNRVTIFGESAGGASVHYHLISPLSKGLIHRAISQSGNACCPWALSLPGVARSHADRLGKHLNCPTDDSRVLVECLKKKDPADLVTSDHIYEVFGSCPLIPFRPVVEPDHPGAFLKEEPVESIKSGNVIDIPWMTGITSEEGALKVPDIYGTKDQDYVKLLDEKFMELAPITLLYDHTCSEKFMKNVTERIRQFYFGDGKIDESKRMDMVDMYTDAWFFIGTDNAVRDHLKALSSPVFYYYFTYKGSFSLSGIFGDAEKDYGVVHGDELQYLFPFKGGLLPEESMKEEDRKMVDVMTRLWVNFATSGNPTPEKTPEIPVKWTPVRTSNLEYFHIGGSQRLKMGANLLSERVNFWSTIPYRSKIESGASRTRDEL
ncbi:venom carboxylesterase-6-like [Venturia canescens]|uniref:venom carboxylesterase-6-like n=1 Tax=Venturia canescens TaxID=32260 RepID=UPI001C9C4670|nr:venom carboxylesterase-6-like [Venturia canescens]